MQALKRLAAVLALAVLPASGQAQSLEQRAGAIGEGTIRFSYAAREGVCGRGEGNISIRGRNDEWTSDCETGPVRLAAQVEGGKVVKLRTYVGGRWLAGTGRIEDLGTVGVTNALGWLEALAMDPAGVKGDAVFPMTLADSVRPWERVLRIAKATAAPSASRQSALFWLGQVAGAEATAHLEEVAMTEEDRRLRDQAVFGLSQLRDGEGVPALLRLARTSDDPKVRKTAFFWLGQSKDPRALALFEEVLTRP